MNQAQEETEEETTADKKDVVIPQNPTLSNIVLESTQILQEIIENGGELTPELEIMMQEKNIQLAGKVDAYAYVWEEMDMRYDQFKKKADEFMRIARSCRKVRDSLKERMAWAITEMGKDSVEGEDYRFKLAKTVGKLVIDVEKDIPVAFVKEIIVKEIDKAKLKAAIIEQKEVPGAHIEHTPSLRKYVNTKKVGGKK